MRVGSVVWSFVQQGGRQAVSYLVFAILALLLPPRDFGVLNMAMVWIAFMAIFSEPGFNVAVVQRRNLEMAHLSTTFALNIVLGLFLSLLGVTLGRPAAIFFKTPDVAPVLIGLSSGFLVNAFSLTQTALAQRDLRFRDLAVRDIAASVLGGGVGIALALRGFGVWSLVGQMLVTSAVAAALIWGLSPWRPKLSQVSRAHLADLWSYSSNIFLYNVFKYFVQNIDKLLIGYLLGPIALGAYAFASRLVLLPAYGFRSAVGGYLFPRFAMMQDDARSLRAAYLFIIKAVMAATVPAMLGLGLLAPKIVPLLFGPKWTFTAPLIQIFCIVAVLQSLIAPVGELMKALGRPRMLLFWSVAFAGMIAVMLVLGSRWGTTGVVGGLAVAHAVGVVINLWIAGTLILVRASDVVRALVPTVGASALLGAFLLAVLNLPMLSGYSAAGLAIVAGAVIYIAALVNLDRHFLPSLMRQLVKA